MKKAILLVIGSLFFILVNAQKASINFEITDLSTQTLTPAKIVILQDSEPFSHELESTEDLACRGHTIYSRTGKGMFQLPAGEYEIWFGKGMEYSVEVQEHIFDRGQQATLKASLKRELNPEGYIGGDMHLHTYTYSGHGDATVEERLISCVAEGLEWAVATDHNAVLDYSPYMKKLDLEKYMATAVGNEVSTPIGHFNTYPLAADSERINSKITVGKELFETIRKEGIDHTLIQINHPRWVDSDFFNTKGLDPFYGTSKHPEWDWDFDAFEVLNENFGIGWRDAPDNKFSVKQDWFNILNQGIKKTGLGNSDSHSVIAQIAGVPRNYIKSSTDNPAKIKETEIVQNIKNQQVSVACGLFVNMIANETNGIGSQVKLDKENPILNLQLTVQAPSWVTCHKAELIENGIVIRTFDIPESKAVNRFTEHLTLQPKKDSWYILIAYGNEPMAPMVQGKEKPVLPIGFTNPIWIDANANDTLTSIFEYSKNLIEEKVDSVAVVVATMKADPAIVYPVFYYLFEKEKEVAGKVAQQFLQIADTRQKQLLYRELSKSEKGIAILQSQKWAGLNLLEEVVLGYYQTFPIAQRKMERFKEQEQTELDEQLNYLEDVLRFAYAEATKKTLKIARTDALRNTATQDWITAKLPNNYILNIGELLKRESGKYDYIHYPLYARMDTSITFFIKTNTNVRISRGNRILTAISMNERFPLGGKLIQVAMKKGANDLVFRLDHKDDAYIGFQEVNDKKLLDASLKDAETVKHLAIDKKVKYIIDPSPKYHGHGIALTDGYRGTDNISSQLWQGWNGENAEFIIDLGEEKTIDAVTVGLLINQKSWIFAPQSIQCAFSKDGVNFSNTQAKELDALTEEENTQIKEIGLEIPSVKARYIKVIAQKINALPDWHAGKGGDAWIALDEVIIE